jgi:transposase
MRRERLRVGESGVIAEANPYCGDVFVFRSKRMDRVKLLAWDGSGMVLVTKWLHQGRFTWPPINFVAETRRSLLLISGQPECHSL